MSRKNYLLTIVLALVAGFAGHLVYGGLVSPRTAEARAREDDSDLKWEYCAVTKAQYVGSLRGNTYWIAYFKPGGNIDAEPIESGVTGNAFAKAVARLGEQGWDMVGEGPLEVRPGQPGGTPTALYFKRRKD